jgi:hypothetical protein
MAAAQGGWYEGEGGGDAPADPLFWASRSQLREVREMLRVGLRLDAAERAAARGAAQFGGWNGRELVPVAETARMETARPAVTLGLLALVAWLIFR